MGTEVQQTNSSVPATAPPPSTQQAVLKSDIVLPKILCMQGLSKLVVDGKAMAGQFVRSTNAEVVGGKDKPFEFIPLKFESLWMNQSNETGDNKTWNFRGYEPRDATNEVDEWEFINDAGVKCKRTKTMHLYTLLPQDIDKQIQAIEAYKEGGVMPDLDAALIPVVISFRNTSFKAAKAVSTLFLKAEELGRDMGIQIPVYGQTMQVSCTLEKNDKGSFYVLAVDPSGKTKPEHIAKAKQWLERMNSMSVKVDDSDDKEPEGKDEAPAGGPTVF
jgi:hypothetical protein